MQRRQDLVIVRQTLFVQHAPTNDAVDVDDKHCARAHAAVLAPHTEQPGDRAFWMEIGKQGKSQSAELLGPGPMAIHAVDTDAQNLGIRRLETRMVALKGGDLGLSATGKVKHIKSEDDVLLAPKIGQADLVRRRGRQRKGGRGLPDGRLCIGGYRSSLWQACATRDVIYHEKACGPKSAS